MAYAASGSAVSGELFGLGAPVVWGGKVKGVRCCFVCGGFWATELGCGVLGCGGGRLWWGFIRLFWWGGGGLGELRWHVVLGLVFLATWAFVDSFGRVRSNPGIQSAPEK